MLADVQDRSSTLRLPDGRRLAYAEYGDPAGRPLIYNHGLLSSRFEAAFADGAARRLGLRLIAVAGLIGRTTPPAADGKPYQKQ